MGNVIQRLSRFEANIPYSVCVRRKKKEKPGIFVSLGTSTFLKAAVAVAEVKRSCQSTTCHSNLLQFYIW